MSSDYTRSALVVLLFAAMSGIVSAQDGPAPNMSFFITSAGPGDGADLGGLSGADAHCTQLAAAVGAGNRTWRAYLSASGPDVHARDRIGSGPWFNYNGVQVAASVDDLHSDNNQLSKENTLTESGGVINGVAAALPHLRATAAAHGRAHIINMCSASAIHGSPDHSSYSASKFAVRGLTEALSIELEADSIVVCDVLPAFVDTAMVTGQENQSVLVEKMGIVHTAADVAELIWSAASGNRVHWFGNRSLGIGDRLARLFPGAARRVLRDRMQ